MSVAREMIDESCGLIVTSIDEAAYKKLYWANVKQWPAGDLEECYQKISNYVHYDSMCSALWAFIEDIPMRLYSIYNA